MKLNSVINKGDQVNDVIPIVEHSRVSGWYDHNRQYKTYKRVYHCHVTFDNGAEYNALRIAPSQQKALRCFIAEFCLDTSRVLDVYAKRVSPAELVLMGINDSSLNPIDGTNNSDYDYAYSYRAAVDAVLSKIAS